MFLDNSCTGTQFEQTRSDLKAYIKKTYKEKWNATQLNCQKLQIIYTRYLTHMKYKPDAFEKCINKTESEADDLTLEAERLINSSLVA